MTIELKGQELEDPQVEAALRNFRQSVRGWSDGEFTKTRTITPKARAWRYWQVPVLGWGLAAILVVSAVSVPVEIHHQRQVAADRAAAEQQKQRLINADQQTASFESAMTDEELLSHVDTDIAQAAPDAMEPLARLMSDTATR